VGAGSVACECECEMPDQWMGRESRDCHGVDALFCEFGKMSAREKRENWPDRQSSERWLLREGSEAGLGLRRQACWCKHAGCTRPTRSERDAGGWMDPTRVIFLPRIGTNEKCGVWERGRRVEDMHEGREIILTCHRGLRWDTQDCHGWES
jgi:hypothetical protein